jgi:phosphoribosyl-AMP cyclohydrolase
MSKELEEGNALTLDFAKIAKIAETCKDAIPVAVQHADTKEVILVAYTNELAMKKAFAERMLILWSTSRNVLWEKGRTSGETFDLIEARVNCEQNSLLSTSCGQTRRDLPHQEPAGRADATLLPPDRHGPLELTNLDP